MVQYFRVICHTFVITKRKPQATHVMVYHQIGGVVVESSVFCTLDLNESRYISILGPSVVNMNHLSSFTKMNKDAGKLLEDLRNTGGNPASCTIT